MWFVLGVKSADKKVCRLGNLFPVPVNQNTVNNVEGLLIEWRSSKSDEDLKKE